MIFQQYTPKIKQRLLLILLAMALTITTLTFFPSFAVYAVDGNGTDDESGTAGGKYTGGPTYARTGWLLYLVEGDSDTVVSDVVAVTCGGTPTGDTKLATRIGNMQTTH